MRQFNNLTGRLFGSLKVLAYAGTDRLAEDLLVAAEQLRVPQSINKLLIRIWPRDFVLNHGSRRQASIPARKIGVNRIRQRRAIRGAIQADCFCAEAPDCAIETFAIGEGKRERWEANHAIL